jgi:hypothetical protein
MHRTLMSSQIMAIFGYELYTLIHKRHDYFVLQPSQFSIQLLSYCSSLYYIILAFYIVTKLTESK